MAKKSKSTTDSPAAAATSDGVPYEVHDAYHALRRAREVIGNKKLMGDVSKHAKRLAQEHHQVGRHAAMLAKAGKISPDQLVKITRNRPTA